MFLLISIAISFGLGVMDVVLGTVLEVGSEVESFGLLGGLYGLAVYIPGLAIFVRRMHDIGKSGWWLFIALVPIGIFLLLYFLIKEGGDGTNEYGPEPGLEDSYGAGAV